VEHPELVIAPLTNAETAVAGTTNAVKGAMPVIIAITGLMLLA